MRHSSKTRKTNASGITIVGAIAIAICTGSQKSFQLFILNMDTIGHQKVWAHLSLPLIFWAAAGVMLQAGWSSLGSVAAVAAGLQLAVVVVMALQGASLRLRLHALKTWGEQRKERGWLLVDSRFHGL